MEDRYIMMVDENGQPFICHAGMFQKAGNAIKSAGTAAANAVRGVGRGRGTRQNHKYLMKVGAPEKPRYLYTQEEVRAYLQGGRRALNNAVDKAGQTAKNAVNTAKNTAKKTVETTKGVANKLKESTGIPAKRRLEESTAAYDKADKEWNKAYETALSTGQSRSNLQWEKDENGEWRKRELNDEQQKRLNAAKAAEKRAGDKLDDATKKIADAADAYIKDYTAYKDSPMEKVDNAVNTAKNAVNKAVDVVKDKAGVDERKRAEEAWDKVPRRVSSDDKEAVEAFRKATEAQKEYRKTPLGAAEYAKERAYEIASGQDGTAKEIAEKVAGKAKEKATEAIDNAKSKYDRMRDEFKEKAEDVKDKTINRNKVKYSEYSEDDPDFDEKNYSSSNRVGDTDFFMYTRPDGRTVILEEDMKWVLPENYTKKGSYVYATLKNLPSATEKGWTWEEWKDNATKEINKAVNKKSKYN